MFRFLAARKAAIAAADHTAGQLILSKGGTAALTAIRRDLRWLGPDEADLERELTFILRALEKRLDYHPPADVRFLDTII